MTSEEEIKRILVVDDEKIITMHLQELLTNLGYDVVGTASNGEEGIKKAKKLQPDLIFMDIIMPGEKNGILAAEEIKRRFDIPIIFLTAYADPNIIEKAKATEPYGYVVKPFRGEELKAAVEIATYKKRMEKKLKESEEKYRTVVNESHDGIAILKKGALKFVNPALIRMLGDPDALDSASILDFIAENQQEKARNLFVEPRDPEGTQWKEEFTLLRKDGSCLPVEGNSKKIRIDGKSAVLAMFHDIEEKKRTEYLLDYLVRAINGRNQIIISNVEKLKTEKSKEKREKELATVLSLLFDNTNTIRKAYELLTLKMDKGRLISHEDPLERLNNALKIITNQFPEREININTKIKGMLPNILADEFLEEVFIILLENSIKFTEEKEVKIDLILSTKKKEDGDYLEIRIEDRSCGIPDDHKEHVFEPYNFQEAKGKGIGLSILKMVLKRYNGEIELEDRVKGEHTKGCSFRMSIPVANKLR